MGITRRDVEYAANLARLKFSAKELESFTGQLDSIVEYVAQLNALKTDAVRPMAHVLAVDNVMREDIAKQKAPDPLLFENAPQLKEKLFQVPKILD